MLRNIDEDLSRRQTIMGIHRDDIILTLDGLPISEFGSQAQNRLSVVSLKLSTLKIVKEKTYSKLKKDDFVIVSREQGLDIVSRYYLPIFSQCFELEWVSKKQIEEIKDEYASYDLLLLDDIQILSNRTKINDVLFGIFNNNLRSKKLIVFTSDKNIDLLVGFEDRLKSRFHSGITLTIQKPDLETISEIIDKKVSENEILGILNTWLT